MGQKPGGVTRSRASHQVAGHDPLSAALCQGLIWLISNTRTQYQDSFQSAWNNGALATVMLFPCCWGPTREQPLSSEAQGDLPGLLTCLQPLWGCSQEQVCPQSWRRCCAPRWGCRTQGIPGFGAASSSAKTVCCSGISGLFALAWVCREDLGSPGDLAASAHGTVVPRVCLSSRL